MTKISQLEKDYLALLRQHGLSPPSVKLSHETISRFMQEARDTSDAEGNGFSFLPDKLRPEFLESLLHARGFERLLEQMSTEIKSGIQSAGLKLPCDVFVGEFPTGSINAQARMTPNGALLLINTGLFMCIYQIVKIVLFRASFAEFGNDGKPVDSTNSKTPYTYDEVVAALSEVVLAYLLRGRTTAAQRFPMEGGGRGIVGGYLTHEAERFVLAHEYGHAISGHLSKPHSAIATTPVGDVEFVLKSWQQEIEADLVASKIMLASSDRNIDDSLKLLKINSVAAGPLIFFAIDEIITSVAGALAGRKDLCIITDHPPSELRGKGLREFFHRVGGDRLLSLADAITSLLSQLRDDIVKKVNKLAGN